LTWGRWILRFGDVAEVGLVVLVERGGDADDDGVHLGDVGVVGGGAEAGFLRLLDLIREDADDVGAAAVELGDFGGSMSKPVTRKPSLLKRSASGRPT
jgi:hypothetical protein